MSKEILNIDEQIEKGVKEVEDMIGNEGSGDKVLGEEKLNQEIRKMNERFQAADNFIRDGVLNMAKAMYARIEKIAMNFMEKTDNASERKYFLDIASKAQDKRSGLIQRQAVKVFKEEKKHLGPILRKIDPEMMEKFEEAEDEGNFSVSSVDKGGHYFFNRLKRILFG